MQNCRAYYEFTRLFGTHVIISVITGTKIEVMGPS